MTNCISELELAELLHGKLADSRLEQVVRHVDDCASCQDTVQMLAEQSDTFANAWQGEVADAAGDEDPEYRQAMQSLVAATAVGADRVDDPQLDQLGPYRLLEMLGSGGMGTVYKALHTKLKRQVALKVLPATRWTKAAAVARFEREMEAIGQLDHPHIVRASDAGEDRGMHFLAMEYVDGLDLSAVVSRLGRLPVADACEVARQAALALQCAHENRLVHRDIKPSNLMLTREGRVKLLDLGLALLGDEHACDQNELTTVGQLMGTLDYMSPEQGLDSHEVDIRSDVYSLGATLHKLLSGSAPFSGREYNTPLKKVVALANKTAPSIRDQRDDLPDELIKVIDRMLAKDRNERFETPKQVVAALLPFSSQADLADLVKRALQAKPVEGKTGCSGQLPPILRVGAVPVKPMPMAGAERTRGWLIPTAAALLFFGLMVAAAVVIHLQTDRGVLIVRAERADAQIVIKRNGKPVQQMQLEQGDNRITVRSGPYQIELIGESDELQLTTDSLIVRRGQEVVVSLEYREGNGTADGMMTERENTAREMMAELTPSLARSHRGKPRNSEAIYDGKPYRDWLAMLEVERKPELLKDAVQAFDVLTVDAPTRSVEASRAILKLMRRYGSRVIGSDERGQLIMASQEVLLAMPAGIVVQELKRELREGNTRSRAFVNFLLNPAYSSLSGVSYGPEGTEFMAAVNAAADELTRLLVELPDDEADSVRADALRAVIDRCQRLGRDCREIEGLVPRLRRGLESLDYDMQYVASHTLVRLEPNNDSLLPALIRLVSTPLAEQQIDAVHSLGLLGPKAAPAVDKLVQILKQATSAYSGDGPLVTGGFAGGGGIEVYRETIRTLGKIGPAASAAIPLLEEFASRFPSPYPEAKEAINQIRVPPAQKPSAATGPSVTNELPAARILHGGTLAAAKPLYDGKTFDQWLQIIQVERKPERLAEAVRAFAKLADTEQPKRTLAALFDALGRLGGSAGSSGEVTMQALRLLPPESVVPAMIEQLENGTTGTRRVVFELLSEIQSRAARSEPPCDAEQSLLAGLQAVRPTMLETMLELVEDSDPVIRGSALTRLAGFLQVQESEPGFIAKLKASAEKRLHDPSEAVVMAAVKLVQRIAPESRAVIGPLAKLASSGDSAAAYVAIEMLTELGPRAAPAVPLLIPIIERSSESLRGANRSKLIYVQRVIQLLGAIGPEAADALPALHNCHRFFREAAASAIAKIEPADEAERE